MVGTVAMFADKGVYQRVGEATELALRVLSEKIGLLGYASHALDSLSRSERATYCNDHWQQSYKKVEQHRDPPPPPSSLMPIFFTAAVMLWGSRASCLLQRHCSSIAVCPIP